MSISKSDRGRFVRAAVVVLTFAVLVVLVLASTPLSLVAPYAVMHFAGLESPWVAGGSYVLVLACAGVCAALIVRGAMKRWPDRDVSFRIGVLAVPVAALGSQIVPLTADWPPGAIAVVALPAAFAVAMGAATAWIARPR